MHVIIIRGVSSKNVKLMRVKCPNMSKNATRGQLMSAPLHIFELEQRILMAFYEQRYDDWNAVDLITNRSPISHT